jgi:hypothetical protein
MMESMVSVFATKPNSFTNSTSPRSVSEGNEQPLQQSIATYPIHTQHPDLLNEISASTYPFRVPQNSCSTWSSQPLRPSNNTQINRTEVIDLLILIELIHSDIQIGFGVPADPVPFEVFQSKTEEQQFDQGSNGLSNKAPDSDDFSHSPLHFYRQKHKEYQRAKEYGYYYWYGKVVGFVSTRSIQELSSTRRFGR